MNRDQVEKIFEINGLNDYRLNSIEDLEKCLGIDAKEVKGYEYLTEENKHIYENFIVNYYNSIGMNSKINTIPKAINYVEEVDYTAPHPDAETDENYKDCVVSIKTEIIVLKADGSKRKLHTYSNEDYKDLKTTESSREEYLRFAFLEGKSKVWLHVTHEGMQWY